MNDPVKNNGNSANNNSQGNSNSQSSTHDVLLALLTRESKMKRRWMLGASLFTLFLVALYMMLHLLPESTGEEVVFLQKEELAVINSIIVNPIDTVKLPSDTSMTSIPEKGAKQVKTKSALPSSHHQASQLLDEKGKKKLIGDFIYSIIDGVDSSKVKSVLDSYTTSQLVTVLPYHPFKVKSFFWLTGNKVLLEVVFWSIFGLIAALMYSVTSARNFNEHLIKEHIGKLFYTPFVSVVIYLSLNALMNSGAITLTDVGKSALVLSFILGFFTRRAILLLVKIKDLILPKTQDVIDSDNEIRNMYPNEIKGIVKNEQISEEVFKKNTENIEITVTRIDKEGVRKTKYSVTETAREDGTFYFNSLLPGDYNIVCKMVIESDTYTDQKMVQVYDSDRPVLLELNLTK